MPKSKKSKTSPQWCDRCQEREAAPDPRVPLHNPQQEKFCRNVALLNMANAKAYTEAGYKGSRATISTRACRLRRELVVQNRIITLSELSIEQDLATKEWVTGQLKEIVSRCMQKVPVIVDGKKTGEWRFDARSANTALQLMGKDLGMFVERLNISTDELHDKTPEEVKEILVALAVDLGRDVVRQMGVAVGIYEAGSEIADPAKKPTVEAVPTVQ